MVQLALLRIRPPLPRYGQDVTEQPPYFSDTGAVLIGTYWERRAYNGVLVMKIQREGEFYGQQ